MCQARTNLTQDDWYLVGFWVSAKPFVDTMSGNLRPDGCLEALRLGQYPEDHHAWLTRGAMMLDELVRTKGKNIDWMADIGKYRIDVTPEDVADA